MAFADTIKLMPVHARTAEAKGFLPPFLRAMGHMLYLLADTAADEPKITVDEAGLEITHAFQHLQNLAGTDVLSTAARDHLATLQQALTDATVEWGDWDAKTRTKNMRDLVNRAVAISVPLDRELLGLPDSDAGLQL